MAAGYGAAEKRALARKVQNRVQRKLPVPCSPYSCSHSQQLSSIFLYNTYMYVANCNCKVHEAGGHNALVLWSGIETA